MRCARCGDVVVKATMCQPCAAHVAGLKSKAHNPFFMGKPGSRSVASVEATGRVTLPRLRWLERDKA